MLKQIAAAAALFAMPVAANAAQIILSPSSVIGSSGNYTLCCDFNPGSIFDQQTGTVTETFGAGYWLNADNGPADAFITIDLGAAYALTSVTLYNTGNGPFGDRGTGSFNIFGSNSITGVALVGPTLVASGTLAAGAANSNPVAQAFAAAGNFRYLSFNPTSVAVAGTPCCGANNYGLNELRVSGSAVVPEPQSWVLLIAGFGLVGAAMRRRAMLAA